MRGLCGCEAELAPGDGDAWASVDNAFFIQSSLYLGVYGSDGVEMLPGMLVKFYSC